MNRKYVIGIVVILLVMVGVLLWVVSRPRTDEVPVTENQKQLMQPLIAQYEERISKDPADRFAYLDKAEYERQLGDADAALATLAKAYAVREVWRQTPDFMILEARAWGQKDVAEGVKRYEALLSREPRNETFYSEYIAFLKRTNQPRAKIIDFYQRVITAVPETLLKDEYQTFVSQ